MSNGLDSYVKLMCHFNGTDGNTTIVDDYGGKTITVNGNAQLDTAQKKFGTASLLLDGTGDYLSIADNADFSFDGDFTVDCHFRINSLPSSGAYATIFAQRATSTSQNSLGLFVKNNSGTYQLYASFTTDGTTEQTLVNDYAFTTNTWYHVEICREGNWIGYFVDGVNIGCYYVGASALHNSTAEFKIGGSDSTTANYFNGWIDEFRLSKGVCRHTLASYTPPTEAYTSDSYTKLLLHMDGSNDSTTFTDSGNTGHTVTAYGDAKLKTGPISTVTQQVGSSMAFFNTGLNVLNIDVSSNTSNFSFGSADFTIEYFMYPTTVSDYIGVISDRRGYTTDEAWTCGIYNGKPVVFYGIGSSTTIVQFSTTINSNTWYHMAFVRNGSNLECYVNGTKDATVHNIGSASINNSYSTILIGAFAGYTVYYKGYLDELRVSKGIARYTSSFTPSTTAFTSDSYTSLLLHFDGTINGSNFTDSGNTGYTITTYGSIYHVSGSTLNPKIGTAMCYLDGAGDYLTIGSSSDFAYGTGDFTIESYIFPESFLSTVLQHFGSDMEMSLIISDVGSLYVYKGGFYSAVNKCVAKNIWQHIVCQRKNGILEFYVDGKYINDISFSVNYANNASATIGMNYDSTAPFKGYLDEFRISKGIARFTPASFTVETSEYDLGITAPTVTTTDPPISIGDFSAIVEGNVTTDGGATVTDRGFVYATSANPTTVDTKVVVSGTTGSFQGTLTLLSPNTTYHFRAYAINSQGTSYSADVDFSTIDSGVAPSTTTVTPLIQILDYIGTTTLQSSTDENTIVLSGVTMSIDDFVINTSRVNASRRVTSNTTGTTYELNSNISSQTDGDSVRYYKFVDHTSKIKQETLSYSERVQGGGNLSFVMITDGSYIPRVGQYVKLGLNNQVYFTGIINSVIRRLGQDGITTKLFFDISATDLKIIPPRRTIQLDYVAETTCSYIVNDMVNNYLNSEGISAGTIEDGVKLSEAWINDCTSIGEVLDEVAQQSGFQWFIDVNFNLQFYQDPTTVTSCSYSISDLTNSFTDFRNVTVEETIDNYCNKAFFAGGSDQNGNIIVVGQKNTTSIEEVQFFAAGSGVYGTVDRDSAVIDAVYEVANAGTNESVVMLGTSTMQSHSITVGDEFYNATRGYRSNIIDVYTNGFELETQISGQTATDTVIIYDTANKVLRNILKRQDKLPKIISFDTFTLGFRAGQKLEVALSSLSMSTTASYVVDELSISHTADKYFKSTIKAILRNDINFSTQKNPDIINFFQSLGASPNKRSGYGAHRGSTNPKVIVSATTPSGQYKTKDMWIKSTPAPAALYTWNGSDWE